MGSSVDRDIFDKGIFDLFHDDLKEELREGPDGHVHDLMK